MEDYAGKGDERSLFKMSADHQEVTGLAKKDIRYHALYIPEGTRIIRSFAFYNVHVGAVILPEGVEEIQADAFIDCVGFKKIFIPKSVTVVEKDAFAGCKQLKIYCEGEPQAGWLDLPDVKKVYYDDMTEAFNFHRSAGSFDDCYIVERTEIIRNTYNPEGRPVFTEVSREQFSETKK